MRLEAVGFLFNLLEQLGRILDLLLQVGLKAPNLPNDPGEDNSNSIGMDDGGSKIVRHGIMEHIAVDV
ncbi:hypothetical protein ACS0TY_010020 [Phlomoides rotata]